MVFKGMIMRMSCGRLIEGLCFCVVACIFLLGGCAGRSGTQVSEVEYGEGVEHAWSVYKEGDCEKSARMFSDLLAQAETPAALSGLGLSHARCGQRQTAVATLRKAVSMAPGIPLLRVQYGNALYEVENLDEAERQFNKALRIEPELYEAGMGYAAVLLRMGRTEEALPVLARLQRQWPDRPAVQFNRAIAMYQLKLYVDAAEVLADYCAQWPDDSDGWNAVGVVELGLEQPENALAVLNRAIALAPDQGAYYFNRATAYSMLKKFAEAKEDYTRSIMYSTNPAGAYLNRGEAHFLSGEQEEACLDLVKACEFGLCDRLERYQQGGYCKSDGL